MNYLGEKEAFHPWHKKMIKKKKLLGQTHVQDESVHDFGGKRNDFGANNIWRHGSSNFN